MGTRNDTSTANNMKFTRVCVDCGKVMHNVGYSRKRCAACAHAASLAAAAKHREAQRREWAAVDIPPDPDPAAIREHAQKRAATSGAALRRDNASARAEGLTYGLWRAKQEGRLK